jgi:hypothetical protein
MTIDVRERYEEALTTALSERDGALSQAAAYARERDVARSELAALGALHDLAHQAKSHAESERNEAVAALAEANGILAAARAEVVRLGVALAAAHLLVVELKRQAEHYLLTARALALEEAARWLESHKATGFVRGHLPFQIRALAPLPPGLVAAPLNMLGTAFHLAWSEGRRTQRPHNTADFAPLYGLLGLTTAPDVAPSFVAVPVEEWNLLNADLTAHKVALAKASEELLSHVRVPAVTWEQVKAAIEQRWPHELECSNNSTGCVCGKRAALAAMNKVKP